MISVVFVEVPAGSTMFPFFTVWGLLVVLPLYLLHSVFLAAVVFRFGRPRFWTLYAAGVLYGMYEAYITKVLWTSFRPEGPFVTLGGIAVFETILLVLYLHPLLAFVDLLRRHGVTALADVRSAPYSRFNPQFNREELEQALEAYGIKYVFLGRELGARPAVGGGPAGPHQYGAT